MKILLIIINSVIFLMSSSKAKECIYAQEFRPEKSKYTEQYNINTDRAGHSVRIFSIVGRYRKMKKNCEGLSLLRSYTWGISDYINKNGSIKGHITQVYSDGSKIFLTFEGTSQNPGKLKNYFQVGFSKIIGGTGTYKNVSGYGLSKISYNFGNGELRYELTLKYTK